MPRIFHITAERDWLAARESGEYRRSTRGKTLEEVGFIHRSDAHQVARIADAIHSDADELIVVLEVLTDALDAEVRYENLDDGAALSPHIYGALPVSAVVSVNALERDAAGRFVFGEPVQ